MPKGGPWEAKMAAGGAQEAQDSPKSRQERPKRVNKMLQKGLCCRLGLGGASGRPPGGILEQCWALRGDILEPSWVHFRRTSGRIPGEPLEPPRGHRQPADNNG